MDSTFSYFQYSESNCFCQADTFFLSQMEHVDQEDHGKAIVGHHGNEVVDGGDQWARGYGGVYTCFFEKQWDTGTYGTGDQHCKEQGNSDAAGYGVCKYQSLSFK